MLVLLVSFSVGSVAQANEKKLTDAYQVTLGDKLAEFIGQWFSAGADYRIQGRLGNPHSGEDVPAIVSMYVPKEQKIALMVMGPKATIEQAKVAIEKIKAALPSLTQMFDHIHGQEVLLDEKDFTFAYVSIGKDTKAILTWEDGKYVIP